MTLYVDRSDDGKAVITMKDELQPVGDGPLEVAVSYSSLNYKDALALSANPGVARILPLVPGIDAIGEVVEDASGRFEPGIAVTVNGGGIGERQHGGYTKLVRCPADAATAIPDVFTLKQAAAIGTAGYTAALCVLALKRNKVESPVVVTGATGGVGSVAVMMLAKLGYEVHAVTGRTAEFRDYLMKLGASEVLDRAEFESKARPLQKGCFGGAVDTVGSTILANILAQTKPLGTVTACGLAAGADLPTTVMPFILRGVTLVGINSVDASPDVRHAAWELLAETIDPDQLDELTVTVPLTRIADTARDMLAGKTHGRTVVDVNA